MEPHLNPFSVLSWIIAPALLTNASTLLVLSTGNRLARAVDRARDLFKQLEDAADLTSREAIRRLGELTATEQRSLMLVAALRSVYIASGSFASATLQWEYWSGTDWRRLSLLKDDTLAFTRSGHVHLQTPSNGMQPAVFPPEVKSLFWIRALVQNSQYERPPKLLAIRTNTIAVQQAQTVQFEVIGGSNGRRAARRSDWRDADRGGRLFLFLDGTRAYGDEGAAHAVRKQAGEAGAARVSRKAASS